MANTMDSWYHFPHSSGFLLFLMGGWLLFAVFHLLLYIRNRNSLYLLYGAYLVAICLYQLPFLEGRVPIDVTKVWPRHFGLQEVAAEASYIIYFFFAFRFLNIKSEFPRWYYYINRALYILIGYCVASFLYVNVFDHFNIIVPLYYGFTIYILILSIIAYVLFFKSNHPLRYYIIVGSLFLTVFSVISLFVHRYSMIENINSESGFFYLYLGYMLETILFGLGLGHLQFHKEQERVKVQQQLVEELKRNEQLQLQVQDQLKKDVEQLEKTSEEVKLRNIEMTFEKELVDLKLEVLRSQMNPHFIFNSLNSIKRFIIDNEQENAVYYLNKFSKLIRRILTATMEKDVTLADELETAQLYLNIENIRFKNEINYSFKVEDHINIETIKIPSLLLQPFLENAVWHGLSLKKGVKLLKVHVYTKNKQDLIIEITDNGIGRKRSSDIKEKKLHKRESVGLRITEERLRNFAEPFKGDYSIQFDDLYDESHQALGTKVTISVPYK